MYHSETVNEFSIIDFKLSNTKIIIQVYLPVLYYQTILHNPRLDLFIPEGQRNFQWLFHSATGLIPLVAPGIILLAATFSGCNSLASTEFCKSFSGLCFLASEVRMTAAKKNKRSTTNLVIVENSCPEQALFLIIVVNECYLDGNLAPRDHHQMVYW